MLQGPRFYLPEVSQVAVDVSRWQFFAVKVCRDGSFQECCSDNCLFIVYKIILLSFDGC